jgi:hypothetical protein
MEMAFIKQNLGKRSNLLILFLGILCSCGGNKTPFTAAQLNEFVVSKELDSTLNFVISHLREGYTSDLVLELMKSDSLLSIDISLQDKKYISKYVYYNNRRIVGFTMKGKDSVLILSNIDNLYDLGDSFSNYLQPIKRQGSFYYLQIPMSLYEIPNNNRNLSDGTFYNSYNWADIPYMYEPFVFSFHIRDNKITYPPYCYRR